MASAYKEVLKQLPTPRGHVDVMPWKGKGAAGSGPTKKLTGTKSENVLKDYRPGNRIVESEGQYWHVPEGATGTRPAVDKVGDQLQNAAWEVAKKWDFSKLSAKELSAIKAARAKGDTPGADLLIAQARGRWVEKKLEGLFKSLKWNDAGPDAFDKKTGTHYEVHSGTLSNMDRHGKREGMSDKVWRLITF